MASWLHARRSWRPFDSPRFLVAGGMWAASMLRMRLLDPQHPNLVLLQSRRVAARAVAQRMAAENGWELGREVGYHIRFDQRRSDQTRLRLITEGILTRASLQSAAIAYPSTTLPLLVVA